MTPQEELTAYRRMAELEDKAAGRQHTPPSIQQEPAQQEQNGNPLINAAYGMAGRGKAMATALNPFSTEQDRQNRANEQAWIEAHPGAGIGAGITDVVSQIPIALAAPELAASKLGSAAIGGLYGFATKPGSYSERAHEGTLGAAGGAIGSTIGQAVPYAGRALKSIAQPFYDTGRREIVSKFLKRVIGNNLSGTAGVSGVINALENAKPLIPGSQPTAAEVANNGGLSAIQRFAAQADPSEYAYRNMSNANARSAAIQSIAKDKVAIDTAKALRGELSTSFYDAAKNKTVPIDNELLSLLHRPSMGMALDKASKIAAETGNPISPEMKDLIMQGKSQGFINGDALHHLKIGLDSLLHDPKNPLAGEEQRALKGTINAFEKWREGNIPEYAKAQKIYKGLSKPINQMQIGQELYNEAKPALTDFGENLTRETGSKFAQALRNSERTVKRATGKDYLTLENTMTKRQKNLINSVAEDFNRKISADELGRGIGSNTFQNLAMQNMSEQSGMLPVLAMKGLSRVPVVGGLLSGGERALMAGPEKEMQTILSEALLDPKKTADLLRQADKIGLASRIMGNKKLQALPGIIGTSTAIGSN